MNHYFYSTQPHTAVCPLLFAGSDKDTGQVKVELVCQYIDATTTNAELVKQYQFYQKLLLRGLMLESKMSFKICHVGFIPR